MWSASVQGWAQCWPPAVSFLMLHLTCCPNQVILGTFLNTPYPHFSYPYFTELNGSYQGHSWKFTFLHIEYLLNSCPWSIVKLVQCCFLSWKIRKWKDFWIGGSFVRWLFFFFITCGSWWVSIHPLSPWWQSVNFSLYICFWSRKLQGGCCVALGLCLIFDAVTEEWF